MTARGYIRVSTTSQSTSSQWHALVAAGVPDSAIVVECASGAARRPLLVGLVGELEEGDQLVVTRLDRLGRGARDLIELLGVLQEKGVKLRSLAEAIDTDGLAGNLLIHVLVAIAEWERESLRERVLRGMASAKARGVHVGRPPALMPVEKHSAYHWRKDGLKICEIARRLSCSEAVVRRAIKEVRAEKE